MYAIIETGGKQVKVNVGDRIYVEKLNAEVDSTVSFDKVLFVGGEKTIVGAPLVKGATVAAKVVKHDKAKKVIVFKYEAKHNRRITKGHRQPYTLVEIESINA